MAVYGYARVSTTGQNLDAQLAALADCDHIFQEKRSGADKDRPELENLLNTVRAGDIVKVTKLCRLARNTRHLLEIVELLDEEEVGLQVLNLGIDTTSSTGRLLLTMIGAVAAFERSLLLERQAEGIAIAKAKGKYTGRQATARAQSDEVLELLQQGHSKQAIADKLGISRSSVYRITKDNNE
ncbi:recombinase family protein [Vibrio ruber]|uniref:recombinase family protein n=1 Tax=Vibrio ruber TaxID=184755 RepID=UPI0028933175|nr:recombinase family protein [Vibrio ruber]WNJ95423.1 recombinase family protein [Vibrio ruber]